MTNSDAPHQKIQNTTGQPPPITASSCHIWLNNNISYTASIIDVSDKNFHEVLKLQNQEDQVDEGYAAEYHRTRPRRSGA